MTQSFDATSSASSVSSSNVASTGISDVSLGVSSRIVSSLVGTGSSLVNTPSPTALSGFLIRIVFGLSSSERESLVNVSSSKRAELEESIVAVYLQGLNKLGGQRRRQLSSLPKAYVRTITSLLIVLVKYCYYKLLIDIVTINRYCYY